VPYAELPQNRNTIYENISRKHGCFRMQLTWENT
jgi:hypothetical protein